MTPKDDIDRKDIPEVVIVVNGALDMGEGKKVGQSFQAAMRSVKYLKWGAWLEAGTRTIVKQAKTQAMFDRIVSEVPGYVMVDEGFTEVEPGTATLFVSWPFLHKDRLQVLDNKKCPLL